MLVNVTISPTMLVIHSIIRDSCVIKVVVIYTPQKRETNGGNAQVYSS